MRWLAVMMALSLVATACGGSTDLQSALADREAEVDQAIADAVDRFAEISDESQEAEPVDDSAADAVEDDGEALESDSATSDANADISAPRDFCLASAEVHATHLAFDSIDVSERPFRMFVIADAVATSIDDAIATAPNAEQAAPAEALAVAWSSIRSDLEANHSYNWSSYMSIADGGPAVSSYVEIATVALPEFLDAACGIAAETDADIEQRVQQRIDEWTEIPATFTVVDDRGIAELQLPYPWEIESEVNGGIAWVHAAPVLEAAETRWDADGVFLTIYEVAPGVSAEDWMQAAIADSAAAQDCEEFDIIADPSSYRAYFECPGTTSLAVVIAEHKGNGIGQLLEGQSDDSQIDGGDGAMIGAILASRRWLLFDDDSAPVPGSREAALEGFGGPGSAYWDLEPSGDASSFCDASVAAWIMTGGFEQATLTDPAVLEQAMTNVDLSIRNAILQAPDRESATPAYIMGDGWADVLEIVRDDYGWDWQRAIADGDAIDAGEPVQIARAPELREGLRAYAATRELLAEFLDAQCGQPTDVLDAGASSVAANWERDFGGKEPTTGPAPGRASFQGELITVTAENGPISVAVPADWQSDEQLGDGQVSWILSHDLEALSTGGAVDGVRFVFVEKLDGLDPWLEFSQTGHAQIRRGCIEQDVANVAEGDVLRTTYLYNCDGAVSIVVSLFDARAPSGLLIQVQTDGARSDEDSLDWIETTLDSVVWDAPTG